MSNLIGKHIEQYRLDALLGDGGMGTVYEAYDTNLNRRIAIKLMHAHYARQAEFQARLTQEAQTAAQLEHPSIVRIYNFGQSDEGLYIAMEYIGGGSLRAHLNRLIKDNKFLPFDQLLQVGAQIAEALDYAHQHGVIHRDVKPGNIILKRLTRPEQDGELPFRAVLTDFGLVKLSEGTVHTETGFTMGTPIYMSPEQCAGEAVSPASDLYSLGVVLYELVTNRPPFPFKTLAEALNAHREGRMPLPASTYRPDTPQAIETILKKLLAKNPSNRFEDGEQTATVLRSAMLSMAGTPTRLIKRTSGQDPHLAQALPEAPAGYHLLIESESRTTNYMPLDKPVIQIGRDAHNDMVLPTEGVSRHHTRLIATAKGWVVQDLGGVNGTFLGEQRIRPNELVPFPIGESLQVGPYVLTLQRNYKREAERETVEKPSPTVTPPPAAEPISQPPQTPSQLPQPVVVVEVPEPLGLFLVRERIPAEPGKTLEIKAEVANRTQTPDRVRIRVEGLPAEWLELPDGFVTAPPNGSAEITFKVTIPRRPDTPVGRQQFRVELVSQTYPKIEEAVQASLLISSFTHFTATLEPQEIELPGPVAVTIQNQSNVPLNLTVQLENEDPKIKLDPITPFRLDPGQTGQVELQLNNQRLHLFGAPFNHDYGLKVISSTGLTRGVGGTAKIFPLLPPWVAYFLVGTLVFACATFAALSLPRSALFAADPTPTRGLVVSTATPLPPQATASAVALAQTVTAATATAAASSTGGDPDGDGLSNSTEQLPGINTDPSNPDTDADGLTDGEEVNQYGTQPRLADTDGDGLSDGAEVRQYGSNPKNPDTDGDGILDGTEVSQGTNPVAGLTPTVNIPTFTPAATSTATPQGATPTLPATVVSATPLTSPTVASSPTAGATPTLSTPTATASVTTAAASPTPSATATASATPTISPTPSATATATLPPTPANDFALVCVTTPPTLDGVLTSGEWPNALTAFQSATDASRVVNVYMSRDAQFLYMGFLISHSPGGRTNTDSLRVYLDTTNNGGDPDTADRFFQVLADGTPTIRAGRGTNNDQQIWDVYESTNWQASANMLNDSQWVVELKIDASAELGALANPFGVLVQAAYTGEIVSWPPQGSSNSSDSWEDVLNISCLAAQG